MTRAGSKLRDSLRAGTGKSRHFTRAGIALIGAAGLALLFLCIPTSKVPQFNPPDESAHREDSFRTMQQHNLKELKGSPEGRPLTIVTLGTSLTNQGGWQEDLERQLAVVFKQPVIVKKVSKGGVTSRWGIQQLDKVNAFKPDILLFEFVVNDSDLRNRVSIKESGANAKTIIDTVRGVNPSIRVFMMTMNPAWGIRGFLRPFRPQYDCQYRKIAASEGVGLIDIAKVWNRLPRADLHNAVHDGVHVTRGAFLRFALPEITATLAGERF